MDSIPETNDHKLEAGCTREPTYDNKSSEQQLEDYSKRHQRNGDQPIDTCDETQEDTSTVPNKRTSVFQGHTLHEYEWRPEGQIRAVVHIPHGLYDHMGRYRKLAEHLKQNGILVRGIDLVGHGQSEGERGHVDSFESYVTDVVNHIKDSRKEFSDIPLFVLGQSMGGLVTTGVTLRIQEMLNGVIISAAGILIDASPILQICAKLIAFFSPMSGLKSIDEHEITSISEEMEAYNDDPLVYRGKIKAGWTCAFLKAIDAYKPRLQEISLPVLLMHGGQDTMVPMASTVFINDTISSTDKTFERFEESRHDILHDKEQERVSDKICQWLLDRTRPRSNTGQEIN